MRICSGPGCLRAIKEDVRFCDECKPTKPVGDAIRNHTSGYDDELDKLRKGTRWQSIRARVVKAQPICQRCELSITEIVDHIVPAREAISQMQLAGSSFDRYAGYYLVSNLQGLCRPCHGAKTNEDKLHTGEWPDVVARERAAPKRKFF